MVRQDHHDSAHASESESSSMGRTPSQLSREPVLLKLPKSESSGMDQKPNRHSRSGERCTRQGGQRYAA